MIRTEDVRTNEGVAKTRAQRGGEKKVIDAPADVAGAGAGHGAPPGVMSAFGLKFPEGIDEAGFEEGAKARAFLRRESVIAHIGLGIGQIKLGVGHVQVAAKDDRLGPLQPAQVA